MMTKTQARDVLIGLHALAAMTATNLRASAARLPNRSDFPRDAQTKANEVEALAIAIRALSKKGGKL